MRSLTIITTAAALASLVQITAVSADPAPTSNTSSACPAGMVAGPDGVCVKQKTGRMGFDLAAPSDDGSSSSASDANTRGIKTGHHHHKHD